MIKDPRDIALHVIPTVLVCMAMGFMAGTALHVLAPPVSWAFFGLAGAAALAFSWIWWPREKFQHKGTLGGRQSWMEALAPLIAGPIAFAVSAFGFWIFPV